MTSTPGSHLSVVVDLTPSQWHLSAQPPPANNFPLSLSSFLSQLLVFLNAHMASKHENTLAVFGAFPGKSVMLYASTDPAPEQFVIDANSYPPFKLVNTTVVKRIAEELDELGEPEVEPPCSLVGAFTKALCYVNRISIPPPTIKSATPGTARSRDSTVLPDPRILILSVSPDLSESYIPIMNAIFSAQKLKVTVDACQVYGPDTVFLQQAAHLTGGSYIYLERRDGLLQYLTMSFLPPPSVRQALAVPTQDRVDFRAACFCHKNIVDVGYVCSVCLSIFCQPVPVCSTCRTRFPMKTLQRLQQSRLNPPPSARPSPATTPRATPGTPSHVARNPSIGHLGDGIQNGNGKFNGSRP